MDKREQTQFYKDLNETSFYFFFSIALTHILSGLLVTNELIVKMAWLINRLLDVPFFLISCLYVYSALKVNRINQNNFDHHFDMWWATIGGSICIGVFIFDLIFANQLPF
jgi:hypothetical protein